MVRLDICLALQSQCSMAASMKNTDSKALRCTVFRERKNSCSSKFVQLLLPNRVKARGSKNRAAQGFYYIRSSQIFLDTIQKRAPARFVQLEAVYHEALLYQNLFLW